MIKFITKLFIFCLTIVTIIVGMHIVAIYNLQDEVESTYTLDPGKDVLFIGSSQVGCGIDEDDRFHNHVLWVSETTIQSFLMRLTELDRRNQLDNIKVVVVPFNEMIVKQQNKNILLWSWYQEIPLSWRYFSMIPYSEFDFVLYVACNLRYPFLMHLSESIPIRDAITQRPEKYQTKMLRQFKAEGASMRSVAGDYSNWQESVLNSYKNMNQICARHNIRFVVYRPPIISCFYNAEPQSLKDQINKLTCELRKLDIEYVDISCNLPDKYFFDSVHLVRDGARLFTEELYKRLGIEIK